jgi:hypothetical protein
VSESGRIIRERLRSVVIIRSSLGAGSGFYVNQGGLIATNRHVVGPFLTVGIQRYDRTQATTRVIRVATHYDLAILWDQSAAPPAPIPLGDAARISPGEPVFAIGHPVGLEYTITRGIVSSTNRLVGGAYHLQTDTVTHPGSSGGPLLDEEGHVVGVSTMGLGAEGLNFALSVRYVHELLGELSFKPARASDRRCPSCGAKNLAVRRSCRKCGMSFDGLPEEERVTEPGASAQPAFTPPPLNVPLPRATPIPVAPSTPSPPPAGAATQPEPPPHESDPAARPRPHEVEGGKHGREPVVTQILRALSMLSPQPESVQEFGPVVEVAWRGCTVTITVFPHAQEPHLSATAFVRDLPSDDAPRVMRRALEVNLTGSLEAKLGLRGSQLYVSAERALLGLDDPEVRALVHRVVEVRQRFLAEVA